MKIFTKRHRVCQEMIPSIWRHVQFSIFSIFVYILESFNPLVANGLSNPYYLDESIFILSGVSSNFSFLSHFSMKFMEANRIAPEGTPCFAVSYTHILGYSV